MTKKPEALKYFKPPFLYEAITQTIHCGGVRGNKPMCLGVRGWGHLTGVGANNLPHDEATIIHDDFGQWVADVLNEAACEGGE